MLVLTRPVLTHEAERGSYASSWSLSPTALDLGELAGKVRSLREMGGDFSPCPALQAILGHDCPMETRKHAIQKSTRAFPLGEDSDEDSGSEE